MRAYVDATRPEALERLWGMTLLERILRQLTAAGVTCVYLRVPTGTHWRARLRRDFRADLLVMEHAPPADGQLTLVLDGASVYDNRLISYLAGSNRPLRVQGDTLAEVRGGHGHEMELVEPARLPSYVPKLRRHQTPYLLPVRSRADLKHAERFMFDVAYKGVTDVVTKYLYPGLVRALTRRLAPTTITPNQVTALSMLLSFGAVPLYFLGHLGLAVVMGLVMSVLDSVDGKLARLTLRESKSGNVMDHGSDFVYFAIWLLGAGVATQNGAAKLLLLGVWLLDKSIVGAFLYLRKRELNDWAPVDALFRLVVLRRNVFLLVLGAGLLAHQAALAVQVLTVWALAGVLFHAGRVLWIVATGAAPAQSRLHGGQP
jgi:phosphatidylglycerophosphate synthase